MSQNGMRRALGFMMAVALCAVCACAAPTLAWADETPANPAGEAASNEVDASAPEESGQDAAPTADDESSAVPQATDEGQALETEVSDDGAAQAPGQAGGPDVQSANAEDADDQGADTDPDGEAETVAAEVAAADELQSTSADEGVPGAAEDDACADAVQGANAENVAEEPEQAELAQGATAAGAVTVGQKQDATTQQAKASKAVKLAKATRTLLSSAGGRLHLALAANRVTSRTLADGLYTFATALNGSARLESKGGSTKAGAAADIYQDNNTVAQRWNITYVGNGYYRIQNASGGNALAVSQAKAKSNVNAQLQKWDSKDAQKWKIVAGTGGYRLVSALSPWLSLSVYGGAVHNSMNVQVHAMRSEKSQVWKATAIKRTIDDGVYRIVNQKSGMSLTVQNASIESGANVEQQKGSTSLGQVFQATYNAKTGYYTFTTPFGTRLDVANGSTASGANAWVATSNNTAAQNWSVVRNSDGSYKLVSAVWGRALDVAGASTKAGANLRVATSGTSAAQKFSFKKLGNWIEEGAYQLFSSLNKSNALEVENGGTSAGANVRTGTAGKGNAQRFYFKPVGGGAYTIQNTASGAYLGAVSTKAQANVRTQTASAQWVPVIKAHGVTFALKSNQKVVLDVYNGSKASGANVWLFEGNSSQAQSFAMGKTGVLADGLYSMASVIDAKYMWDDRGQSRANGERLQVSTSNGTIAQEYYLTRLSSGSYRITSAASGKALQAMGQGTAQVQQQTAANTAAQQWALVMNSDGSITFLSALASNKTAITLGATKPAAGTKVNVAANTSSKQQHWKVRELNKPIYKYDQLSITLNQFATYQFNSPYNTGYTLEQMRGYVNPDNANPYEFVDLRVGTGLTAAQLDEYLRTHGAVGGSLLGLGAAFVEGARANGLNEVYLLANAIMESGWGKSTLASGYAYGGGTIDGEYYPAGTYYNFYGIGAYDTSPLSGGRKLAIINGWSSPEKAVTGAAEWLAKNYIYRSEYAQPTLYAMRWDYAYSDVHKTRGWHQYASGVNWGEAIAKIMAEVYASAKVSVSHTYIVPKFA